MSYTITDLIIEHASCNKEALRFLDSAGAAVEVLAYKELVSEIRSVAYYLKQNSDHGDRVVLLFDPGLDFIKAFLGCLYVGRIPVPCYSPRDKRSKARLASIITDCDPSIILSHHLLRKSIQNLGDCNLSCIYLEDSDYKNEQVDSEANEIAFLQYTSGSTSDPKGVIVSHENLLANQVKISEVFGQSEASCVVSWLPAYHDMGLIGGILHPLYLGSRAVLMAPATFLNDPCVWLKAISDYGGTISGGPDFSFNHCCEMISPEMLEELDLSSWELAFNGAERVRSSTLNRFSDYFQNYGFRRTSFSPCYGLAEATLMVSGNTKGQPPATCKEAKFNEQTTINEEGWVSSGKVTEADVLVVSDNGDVLTENKVGEIFATGDSICQGYWGKDKDSFRVNVSGFDGTYLATGDLGFISGGELFITGRKKTLIISRGENLYPEDIEDCVRACDQDSFSRCQAAAFDYEDGDITKIVVVAEVISSSEIDYLELERKVQAQLSATMGLALHELVFVRRGTLPRTSSGKIQRHLCCEAYLAKKLLLIKRSKSSVTKTGQDIEEHPYLIWMRGFLKASDLKSCDSLLGYGLDSLKAVKLVTEFNKRFHKDLTLHQLWTHLTVDEILTLDLNTPDELEQNPTESGELDEISAIQKSIWLAELKSPGSQGLYIPVRIPLPERFDSATGMIELEMSFKKLINQESWLKRSLSVDSGDVAIVELDAAAVEKAVSKLTSLRRVNDWDVFYAQLKQAIITDYSPLWRLELVASGEDKYIAGVFHHVIIDGNGLQKLFYQWFNEQEPEVAIEKPCVDQSLLRAWQDRTQLWQEGIPLLPHDFVIPNKSNNLASFINHSCSAELTHDINTTAKQKQTTPYVVWLSALFSLLWKITHQDNLIIGVYDAAVSIRDVTPSVIPLPITVTLSEKITFEELIDQVKGQLIEASGHRELFNSNTEYRDLVSNTHTGVYLNSLCGITGQEIDIDQHFPEVTSYGSQNDVNIYLWMRGDTYEIRWQYQQRLFDHETMQFWIDGWLKFLKQMVHFPGTKLSELKFQQEPCTPIINPFFIPTNH